MENTNLKFFGRDLLILQNELPMFTEKTSEMIEFIENLEYEEGDYDTLMCGLENIYKYGTPLMNLIDIYSSSRFGYDIKNNDTLNTSFNNVLEYMIINILENTYLAKSNVEDIISSIDDIDLTNCDDEEKKSYSYIKEELKTYLIYLEDIIDQVM